MMHLFCRHTMESVSKKEQNEKHVVLPENNGSSLQWVTDMPLIINEAVTITEVFVCKKCGKIKIVKY